MPCRHMPLPRVALTESRPTADHAGEVHALTITVITVIAAITVTTIAIMYILLLLLL